MTFNVSTFASKINGTGLAKSNLFVSAIKSPNTLPIENDLLFLCKTASIPGMDISTIAVKPQGWGKTEYRPIDYTKNNLTLIFMVDSNFAVKQYFHKWLQSIVNYNDLKGNLSEDPEGKLPYEFDYKENYVGTIDVVVYADNTNNQNARTYTYHFTKAFPISLGPVETSWENQAEIMTMTVTFAFDSMTVSGMNETAPSMRSTSPAYTITAFGGAIDGTSQQVFSISNLPTSVQDAVNQFAAPLNNTLLKINSIKRTGTEFIASLKRIF